MYITIGLKCKHNRSASYIKNRILYQKPPIYAMIFPKNPIKSFVQRNGRMSKRQRYGLTQHLNQYTLPQAPWDLSSYHLPIIVEIGFGLGDTFIEMAEKNPQYHYIGIEVYQTGIGHVAATLHERQIQNVHIAPFDAIIALNSCIPANTLQCIQLFFPDPLPKKRHHKRRLIQPAFVNLCVEKLKPQG